MIIRAPLPHRVTVSTMMDSPEICFHVRTPLVRRGTFVRAYFYIVGRSRCMRQVSKPCFSRDLRQRYVQPFCTVNEHTIRSGR